MLRRAIFAGMIFCSTGPSFAGTPCANLGAVLQAHLGRVAQADGKIPFTALSNYGEGFVRVADSLESLESAIYYAQKLKDLPRVANDGTFGAVSAERANKMYREVFEGFKDLILKSSEAGNDSAGLQLAQALVQFGQAQGGASYELGYPGLQATYALKDLSARADKLSPKVRQFLLPEFEKVKASKVRD